MAITLAECSSIPFHLGLTEPAGDASGYPAMEGAYDPVEQVWRLPDGMLLTDSRASGMPLVAALSLSHIDGMLVGDDVT
jgi:hypothetical protein